MHKLILLLSIIISSNIYANSFYKITAHPGDIIDGHPLAEYANLWWQWTNAMPKNLSPVRDKTGEHCNQGQEGSVWFLAGGYGTSTIKRKCTVPEGKHIFFPVINMVYYHRKKGAMTCDRAKELAALNNDELLSINIEIDSITALNPAHTRLSSPECFDFLAKVPRELNPPKYYPAASDGYWVMLKPLSKGAHSIKFQAKYDRTNGGHSKMAQDIEYEIIVE